MKRFSKNTNENESISPVIQNIVDQLKQREAKIKNHPVIPVREYQGYHKIIEIKNLDKEFKIKKNKFKAVNNLSLNLYKNLNTALLGSNGAGKTTTVEMIVGISKPSAGQINYLFPGVVNNKMDETKIGIQFQDSSYPQGLTVQDVVDTMNRIYGSKTTGKELEYLIKVFGIDEFYSNKAASLSGGQHQRLNALLAIINKPEMIILDELSTGLDLKIKTRLIHFIKDYAKEINSTILIISHDIREIELLVDRIIIMSKGKVVYDRTKQETIELYGSLEKCLDEYI
ncbi:ABC transporter ATP-binding protein [Ureaplasma zalophigenitalium]|uniref:ABC transporter ATP-binding protein n=1 Tax=Ureaplasma zalophigenitalium TaxID=907723 RepID=A0ABT3BPN9_9BACT|nr:ABC transporter ATP-binding protein [Ureaplasma zalophigenitalium]MCV3754168.1 ABC transporter ATP-binding protein [Ureaplasma zalophigenitalium]